MTMSDQALVIRRLEQAISEALRFLDSANAALEAFEKGSETTFHSPSFAAAKRASLDLTRELARLRRWRDA
jgi:hypothetical protein